MLHGERIRERKGGAKGKRRGRNPRRSSFANSFNFSSLLLRLRQRVHRYLLVCGPRRYVRNVWHVRNLASLRIIDLNTSMIEQKASRPVHFDFGLLIQRLGG